MITDRYKRELVYSHSVLEGFQNCPLQFSETRINGNFTIDYGTPTPEKIKGRQGHKAFEEALALDAPELPPFCRDIPGLDKAYAYLLSTKASLRRTYGNILTFPEHALAIDRQYNPRPYHGPKASERLFIGKADCTFVCNPHSKGDVAVIADLKTGNSGFSTPKQLERMALLVFKHFRHINRIKAFYIWTPEDARVESYRFTRKKDMQMLEDTLKYDIGLVVQCHEKDHWPARPSGLCARHCPVTDCVNCGE